MTPMKPPGSAKALICGSRIRKNSNSWRESVLREARRRHAQASLPAVSGGDWMVEHWLAAYAVLLLG